MCIKTLKQRFKNTESNLDKWLKEEGEKLLKELGIEEGHVILDFGCGSGSYSIPAAKIVGQKGEIYALDKDENALNGLVHKAGLFRLKNVKAIQTSKELEIGLKDEACDVILLFDVFHEYYFPRIGERRRLLQELYRILKPNGFLSVYPKHMESKAREEIESSNFSLESEYSVRLIHDDVDLEEGQVLRFRKRRD